QGPEALAPAAVIASDGVVTLRAPGQSDARLLVAMRDEEFHRWLGPGAEVPAPVACVWVGDELVGWVDYDADHKWLGQGEVNVGYFLTASARGKGYASRAVELLLHHLREDTEYSVATLVIHPENVRSLALARRLGFTQKGEADGQPFFVREIESR
ncbi:MAG TPA: GNAT family N-acetyltransferase, partial [Gaiellaceae bacterium]|nr:GNAT family N-acetyltransferase [Gaiellaceae bacterium]